MGRTNHRVEDRLLGLPGQWLPSHQALAREARLRCSPKAPLQLAVIPVVLEMWQQQQAGREAEHLSDLVVVSTHRLTRELYGESRDADSARRSLRRSLDQLVERGVLIELGRAGEGEFEHLRPRGKRERVFSLAPLINAVAPPAEGGENRTSRPNATSEPDIRSGTGAQTGPHVRNGDGNRTSGPVPRGHDVPPSRGKTSPPGSGGEERSDSRAAGSGRAGPTAQPPPALRERDWLSIERALRDQRDAALSGTTHRRSLTALLDRAERRDPGILRVPAVATALHESRRLAVPA